MCVNQASSHPWQLGWTSGRTRSHLYGKVERPARKVGHVTALGSRLEEVRARAVLAAGWLARGEWADGWSPHDADARATRYPRSGVAPGG